MNDYLTLLKIILQVLLGLKSAANVETHVSIISRSSVYKKAAVLTSFSTTINKELPPKNNLILLTISLDMLYIKRRN